MPKEIAFGYDAYSNLSPTQQLSVKAGITRPQSTVGYRWHYTKMEAYKMNKKPIGAPMTGLISKAITSGAWEQISIAPTSTKCAWYLGSIVLEAAAIYFAKPELRSKAKDLYILGDNTEFKTGVGDIQSAAKNVYRKCAKAMEAAGLSSSNKQVQTLTRLLKNFANVSEIEFGQNLSAESSGSIKDIASLDVTAAMEATASKKRDEVSKQVQEVKKARGLDVSASKKMPFKNKQEGNAFRAWVNDNEKAWAKKEKLDRSGSYKNKTIQKAWDRWGQAYTEDMAQKAFLERKNDDLDIPTPVATPKPISSDMASTSAFDQSMPLAPASDPLSNEDTEVGMMELLQSDPGQFLKKYWYVPAGGFVGIIGLALGIRALTK
jgi:post-segregation antitoxin (ccd killing protein)